MRKCLLFLIVFAVAKPDLRAQANEFRRFDINYNPVSYSRQGALNQYGSTVALTVHLNERIGIVADLGVHQPADTDLIRTYTYRFGPKFSNRIGDRITTFGQILVGGARFTVPILGTSSPSLSGFSMLSGGGVDIGVTPWFAVRAIEGGYSGIHISGAGGGWSNGIRVSVGIVFRFGQQ